jgi:serine O-acetyltransferase
MSSIEQVLSRNVKILSKSFPEYGNISSHGDSPLPSVSALKKIVELIKAIVFPGFFDERNLSEEIQSYFIGVNLENLLNELRTQITRGLLFDEIHDIVEAEKTAEDLAIKFIDQLPEIKRLLYTDVEAMFNNDPAVKNYGEVIFCYPIIRAMLHYRVAHTLLTMNIPVLPRIITEMAHSSTGIDIHPGAQIGEYFAIDHGTGVVIGETCVIGNHVTLYQGVTLGAKNFTLDEHGHPINLPRHPIIEDNVTIYSNSSILGRITIGHDSVIGGNVWLTYSVAPGSRIMQSRAVAMTYNDGLGI